MGGGSTTEVTNTGLGDDQYQTLADNQVGLGTSIDAFSNTSTKSMNKANTGLTTANKGITGLASGQEGLASGQHNLVIGQGALTANQARIETALGAQGTMMTDKFGNVMQTQKTLADAVTQQGQTLGEGQTAIGTQVDTVNTNVGNVQTAVDQGFTDTLQGQTDLGTQMTSGFDAAGTQLSTGLGSATEDINTALSGTESAIQGSVQDNATSLSTLSGNVDAYSTQTLQNQGDLAAGQEQYTTKFDDYITRYEDDTTLADQTRADIQTGQANAADASRLQIANLADATADGQVNLQTAATDAANQQGTAIEAGFTGLADANATGVDAVQNTLGDMGMAQQQAQQNLITDLGWIREGLSTGLQGLDENTKQQYQGMIESFDDQGNLIANSIDAQGNTLSREMDAQGNILTTTLDAQGQALGTTSTNVNTMIANAKAYQQETQMQMANTQGLMTDQSSQFNQDLSALNTNITNQGQLNTQAVQQGFDGQSGKLETHTRDLANIASMQGDLTQQQRDTYKSLSSSFDDQGSLISNSIDNQGNTITRAMDNQGNLLLRKFDAQGRAIGDQAMNMNRELFNLSNMQQIGANAGMGGLTQANKAGMAQSGGFASPYTIT
jgi:frataxin-like iron-binding protein CyaY